MDELKLIHFVAQMINARESISQGYTMPTLWLVTRKDLQEKYIKEAEILFENWKKEELGAKERRDSIKYEVKEYPIL